MPSGKKPSEGYNSDMSSRLARVEEGHNALRNELHTLAVSFRETSERLHEELRDISDKVSRRAEPKWGVYFTGLGVLLAFIIAVGGGAMAPLYLMSSHNSLAISEVKRDVGALEVSLASHAALPGHPTAMAKHNAAEAKSDESARRNERLYERLDETLQREMRLLDTNTETKIKGLDEKLQQEIRLNVERLAERIGRVKPRSSEPGE